MNNTLDLDLIEEQIADLLIEAMILDAVEDDLPNLSHDEIDDLIDQLG